MEKKILPSYTLISVFYVRQNTRPQQTVEGQNSTAKVQVIEVRHNCALKDVQFDRACQLLKMTSGVCWREWLRRRY